MRPTPRPDLHWTGVDRRSRWVRAAALRNGLRASGGGWRTLLLGTLVTALLGVAAPTATPTAATAAVAATTPATTTGPNPWIQIAPGATHTCGLHADGSAQCWGSDQWGQSTVPAGPFTQLAVGTTYSCGLHPDGTVECRGIASFDTTAPPGTWTHLVAHDNQTCVIHPDDSALC